MFRQYAWVVLPLIVLSMVPTIAAASGSPSGPQDVELSPQVDGSMRVTWSPPATDGGSPIVLYTVERLSEAGWEILGSTQGQEFVDSSATIAAFAASIYKVVAANADGQTGSTTAMGVISPPSDPFGHFGICHMAFVDTSPSVRFNGTCAILFLTSPVPDPHREFVAGVLTTVWETVLDAAPVEVAR